MSLDRWGFCAHEIVVNRTTDYRCEGRKKVENVCELGGDIGATR